MQNLSSIGSTAVIPGSSLPENKDNLSKFVPQLPLKEQTGLWHKIKQGFSYDTPLSQIANLEAEALVKDWEQHKVIIENACWECVTTSQKKLISETKIILNKLTVHAPEKVLALLQATMQKAVESDHPNKAVLLVELLGAQSLIDITTKNSLIAKDTFSLAKDLCESSSAIPKKLWIRTVIERELSLFGSVVFNFFSHLIDTFLRAFNFYDDGKHPSSYWEYSTLLDIYLKAFLIPYVIFATIKPLIVVSTAAYLGTALLVAALATGVFIYVRWIRPKIQTYPWLTDLVSKAQRGELPNVIEGSFSKDKALPIDRVMEHLTMPASISIKHLLIIGPTGSGKTTIINGAAQRIAAYRKDHNAPASLKEISLQQINTAQFISGDTEFGYTQKFAQIRSELKRAKIKPFVFFDEFGDAFKHNAFGNALIEELDSGNLKCIGAMTDKEWEAVKDKNAPLKDRFTIITLKYPEDHMSQKIIMETFSKMFPNILITEKACETVVTYSKKKITIEEQSPIRLSIDLMGHIVAKFQAVWKEPYQQPELEHAMLRLTQLKVNQQQGLEKIPLWENTVEAKKLNSHIQETKSTIEKLKIELNKKQESYQTLQKTLKNHKIITAEKIQIAQLLLQNPSSKHLEKSLLFYQYLYMPAVSQQYEKQMGELKLPKQIDDTFVQEYLDEMKNLC